MTIQSIRPNPDPIKPDGPDPSVFQPRTPEEKVRFSEEYSNNLRRHFFEIDDYIGNLKEKHRVEIKKTQKEYWLGGFFSGVAVSIVFMAILFNIAFKN